MTGRKDKLRDRETWHPISHMEQDDARWHPFQPDRLTNTIHLCTSWRWLDQEEGQFHCQHWWDRERNWCCYFFSIFITAISSTIIGKSTWKQSSKLNDSRSKCYKQLSDSNNLKLCTCLFSIGQQTWKFQYRHFECIVQDCECKFECWTWTTEDEWS